MKNIALFIAASIILVLVIVSPLPVVVRVTPPPVIAVKKVVVEETTSVPVNVTVGEGSSTGNETIGFIWGLPGNPSYYVRITALDVYDENTWRLGKYSLHEIMGLLPSTNTTITISVNESSNSSIRLVNNTSIPGTISIETSFSNVTSIVVHVNITSLDLIPTIQPSIKIIPVPQPVIYDNLSKWLRVQIPRFLADDSNKFIAARTLYLTNTTNYSIIVKWPINFKPFPFTTNNSLVEKALSVKIASIIGPPAHESSKRIQEYAQLLRREFYTKSLRMLLEYLISFLQSATRYDPNPPPTPKNRDMVDYFLYTSLKGSCLHYATALAVLLRDMGLKARVVLGYITQPYNETHQVIRNPPHLWVEIYVPGYGWLQVDPTPPAASSEPSPRVLSGVEKNISRYVSGEFKREVESYKRTNRLNPREPVEVNGTKINNTRISTTITTITVRNTNTSSFQVSLQWIASSLLGVALMAYASIIVVNFYEKRKKRLGESEVKELLREIALKKNISLPVDYMTPREVVLKIIEYYPEHIKLELIKFLEAYEKSRYGGRRKLLNEALQRLRNIYSMV